VLLGAINGCISWAQGAYSASCKRVGFYI
jgi:hypothetical protein